jgi:hypothetical protein
MTRTSESPVTIFSRVFNPEKIDLSPEAAESLLKLAFDQADRDRMHELAVKNQADKLTAEERAELNNYEVAGHLVALIQAKARLVLRKSTEPVGASAR